MVLASGLKSSSVPEGLGCLDGSGDQCPYVFEDHTLLLRDCVFKE